MGTACVFCYFILWGWFLTLTFEILDSVGSVVHHDRVGAVGWRRLVVECTPLFQDLLGFLTVPPLIDSWTTNQKDELNELTRTRTCNTKMDVFWKNSVSYRLLLVNVTPWPPDVGLLWQKSLMSSYSQPSNMVAISRVYCSHKERWIGWEDSERKGYWIKNKGGKEQQKTKQSSYGKERETARSEKIHERTKFICVGMITHTWL